MKAKSKKILMLSLCGALVLGGVACAIATGIEAEKSSAASNAILEKYEYNSQNAILKNDRIFELTQKLENKEISFETYQQEARNVKDVPYDEFIQEYATEEDAKSFENARNRYIAMTSVAGVGTTLAVAGVLCFYDLEFYSKEEEKEECPEFVEFATSLQK